MATLYDLMKQASSAQVPPPPAPAPEPAPSGPAPQSLKYASPTPFPNAGTTPTQIDGGIVGSAMNSLPTSNTKGQVSTVDGTKFDGQQAEGYTANQGQAALWNVDGNQTVRGQINSLINEDSPLMQQAATRAKQEAASRGLINSSLAVQAGQAALYDKALPIAQSDANTYAQSAKSNQDATNSFSQFNANAQNQASQFGANARNTLQSQKIDVQSRADLSNAGAANDALARDAQINSQQAVAKFDSAVKVAMQNADAAGKLQLQQVDANVRTQLADIEANYKNQMQTSQSVAASYQSMVDNITRIMANPDLDAGAKQAAINNLTKLYNNAMQMQSQVSGLQLGSLLSPEFFGATPTSTTPDRATTQPVTLPYISDR